MTQEQLDQLIEALVVINEVPIFIMGFLAGVLLVSMLQR